MECNNLPQFTLCIVIQHFKTALQRYITMQCTKHILHSSLLCDPPFHNGIAMLFHNARDQVPSALQSPLWSAFHNCLTKLLHNAMDQTHIELHFALWSAFQNCIAKLFHNIKYQPPSTLHFALWSTFHNCMVMGMFIYVGSYWEGICPELCDLDNPRRDSIILCKPRNLLAGFLP